TPGIRHEVDVTLSGEGRPRNTEAVEAQCRDNVLHTREGNLLLVAQERQLDTHPNTSTILRVRRNLVNVALEACEVLVDAVTREGNIVLRLELCLQFAEPRVLVLVATEVDLYATGGKTLDLRNQIAFTEVSHRELSTATHSIILVLQTRE